MVSGVASKGLCAAVGAGVVIAVHYGRHWADGSCSPSADCLSADASIQRNLLVAVAVPTVALIILAAARVHRAWLVVPVAFLLQGAAMLAVEHADGFRLPLWLDLIIAVVTWVSAALLVQRR